MEPFRVADDLLETANGAWIEAGEATEPQEADVRRAVAATQVVYYFAGLASVEDF